MENRINIIPIIRIAPIIILYALNIIFIIKSYKQKKILFMKYKSNVVKIITLILFVIMLLIGFIYIISFIWYAISLGNIGTDEAFLLYHILAPYIFFGLGIFSLLQYNNLKKIKNY